MEEGEKTVNKGCNAGEQASKAKPRPAANDEAQSASGAVAQGLSSGPDLASTGIQGRLTEQKRFTAREVGRILRQLGDDLEALADRRAAAERTEKND